MTDIQLRLPSCASEKYTGGMKMKPMPRRFDRLFNTIVLDFNKYVDIMKPMVLIAAQTTTSAGTTHTNVSRVKNPR